MFRPWLIVFAIIAAVFLAGTMVVNAADTQGEKSTVVTPTPAAEKTEKARKLAAATEAAKQLLLVMDTDKSWQGLQGRMDEVYGNRVRQVGHGP